MCIAAASSGRGTRQARPAFEREIGAAIDDAVEIVPPDGRGARVEIIRGTFGGENRNRVRPQMRIECVAYGVGIPLLREIDMGDLSPRMDAGIGTAGALYQRFIAGERFDRGGEQALHGELVGLDLPAGKWPAVIFNVSL